MKESAETLELASNVRVSIFMMEQLARKGNIKKLQDVQSIENQQISARLVDLLSFCQMMA